MHSRRPLGFRRISWFPSVLSLIMLAGGCGTSLLPGDNNASPARPDDGADGGAAQAGGLSGVDSIFGAALVAAMPAAGELSIEGAIQSRDEVVIYALGPAAVGDRVTIDVSGHDGLNTVAALFDANGNLIDASDDRSYYAGKLDPYISRVIREDTPELYLGVAISRGTAFSSSSGRYDQGSFTALVRREPGAVVAAALPQVVYLNFEGGDQVRIGMEPIEDMRPFSAESISGRFAGQTEYIVERLVEKMRQDYAAYQVVLYDSKHDPVPAEQHSTLYFGNYSAAFLGLADNVDTGNASLVQEAIVYSEDLAGFESLQPSAEEAAQALANVASHELGHLLGLEHTAENQDLMATAATARQILEGDASFMRVRLQAAVFPLGWQDNPHLLTLNVGANPLAEGSARMLLADPMPKASASWRDNMPDIPIVQCSRCGPRQAGH